MTVICHPFAVQTSDGTATSDTGDKVDTIEVHATVVGLKLTTDDISLVHDSSGGKFTAVQGAVATSFDTYESSLYFLDKTKYANSVYFPSGTTDTAGGSRVQINLLNDGASTNWDTQGDLLAPAFTSPIQASDLPTNASTMSTLIGAWLQAALTGEAVDAQTNALADIANWTVDGHSVATVGGPPDHDHLSYPSSMDTSLSVVSGSYESYYNEIVKDKPVDETANLLNVGDKFVIITKQKLTASNSAPPVHSANANYDAIVQTATSQVDGNAFSTTSANGNLVLAWVFDIVAPV